MKYSLACCYLTHNHPEVVKEILDRCLKAYADHDIDICMYDDSDDDATKNLVEQYIAEGASNLYYVDIHEAQSGDHKHYLLMQGYGLPKDYDYIWPSKDRVCFESSYLDNLCAAIDEGHDVIIGNCEGSRWDVGINVLQDVYNDPVEFYRKYAVVSTNWEALIRKRDTMLNPIDWAEYEKKYKVGGDCNFNQTITLFARLSEMKKCSMRICRYTYEERFISQLDHSSWGNMLFELWIDRWVSANFSLPNIYDKYKAEAIKSETNLTELFGSVERFIYFKEDGLYNKEIFEKYKDIWPFVTEIPPQYLRMIADNDYAGAIKGTIDDFERCFANNDFPKAWWMIAANTWFKTVYDEKTYGLLVECFNQYRRDMMRFGRSSVFEGVNSIQTLREKYLNK